MKAICLILVLVSANSFAQNVRENVKFKERSLVRAKHLPETFEDTKVESVKASPKTQKSQRKR